MGLSNITGNLFGSGGYFSGNTNTQASMTPTGELMTSETEREKNVLTSYVNTAVTSASWAMLVSKNNASWPHQQPCTRLDLSCISMQVDRSAAIAGEINIGLITRVDATNGDVTFLKSVRFDNSSQTFIDVYENYSPSQIKTGVSANGTLISILTNNSLSNTTGLQTDVLLNSALGSASVAPAAGDLVIRYITSGAGTYAASVRLLYHAENV